MYPNDFIALLHNPTLWIAAFACVSAQVMKVLIEFAYTRKMSLHMVLSTGGMPSSHSALVVAMATSVGKVEGLHTPLFAAALVFALIVMHDAAGVRRAAGKQAKVLNMMLENLENQGIKLDEKLKELLGHSPIEVIAGAIWGVSSALVAHMIILY